MADHGCVSDARAKTRVGPPVEPQTGHGPTPAVHASSRELIKVLSDDTRYAMYVELSQATRPLTTAELASAVRLHPNTVRPHLEKMREVGVVDVSSDGCGSVGRPQHRYSLAADAPSLGLEPPAFGVLTRMLIDLVDIAGASPQAARLAGVREGTRRAQELSSTTSTVEALIEDSERLGFAPTRLDGDADGVTIEFGSCPFGDLAHSQPQTVCSLHHGMLDGLAETNRDAVAIELTPIDPSDHNHTCSVLVTRCG